MEDTYLLSYCRVWWLYYGKLAGGDCQDLNCPVNTVKRLVEGKNYCECVECDTCDVCDSNDDCTPAGGYLPCDICSGGCCTHYECCDDNDCEGNEVCQSNECSTPVPEGTVCDQISETDIDEYAAVCQDGSCDTTRYFAFDSLDLRAYYPNSISPGDGPPFVGSIIPNDIYCCQEGKNCSDGYTGCEPSCTSCCDVNSCTNDVCVTDQWQYLCSNGTCNLFAISLPILHDSGNDYFEMDWSSVNWSTQEWTCGHLKSLRTVPVTHSDPCCQPSVSDSDLPCMLRLVVVDQSGIECPTDCQ